MPDHRDIRLSGTTPDDPTRMPSQIDRDRILYSMPFRRLAGVTQVVSPGEGEIFHNRLTHSLKVAQIARRFAEHFRIHYRELVAAWGGLDPEVVEAAALAHDLGHPPFGHIAEKELDHLISNELCKANGEDEKVIRHEGYEGNAQSFRIITELAVRRPKNTCGLDLTRATLNATLKYPWKYRENPDKLKKYGNYAVDDRAFKFARDGMITPGIANNQVRSLEAQIMDWSDDIAYSVHDTEDFYRAGLIPLDRLAANTSERGRLYSTLLQCADEDGIHAETVFHHKIFEGLFNSVKVKNPYSGEKEQQEFLYDFVSTKYS